MSRPLRRFILPVFVAGAAVAAVAVALVAAAASQSVTVQNFSFQPPSVTVNAGESVTWTNMDPTTHTVTADNASFNQSLAPGASTTIRFSQAGTFAYHCSIHSTMHGTVVVLAATGATPTTAVPQTATTAPTTTAPQTATTAPTTAVPPPAATAAAPATTPVRTAAAPATGSGARASSSDAPLFIVAGGALLAVALGALSVSFVARRH